MSAVCRRPASRTADGLQEQYCHPDRKDGQKQSHGIPEEDQVTAKQTPVHI